MTPKTASELKREALLASQSTATVVGPLASEYAGHAIAAMVMPGRLDAEHAERARKLLPLAEALAGSLRRYLDADKSNGDPAYTFAVSAAEFSTVLSALSALRVLIASHGPEATSTDYIADATGAPRAINDPEVIAALQERLIASAGRQS